MTQLIPNGKQQFVDINGRPLVGGKVYFYSVGTSTPKDTYQDAAETVLNTNPITLNARGQASIYGTGNYRQVLRDIFGNLIWDQVVVDPASLTQANLDQFKTELAAPDGSQDVGWGRLPITSKITNVHAMLDAQPVALWEHADLVVDRPNPTDITTWNWGPALIAACAAGRVVDGNGLTYGMGLTVIPSSDGQIQNATFKAQAVNGVLMEFSGSRNKLNFSVDCNFRGITAVLTTGNDNTGAVSVRNLTGVTQAIGGTQSCLKMLGTNNEISVTGVDIIRGTSDNDSIPRVLTTDGTGSNNRCPNLIGRNVQGGWVNSQVLSRVQFALYDGIADNGIYGLAGGDAFCGTLIVQHGTDEPFVCVSSNLRIDELQIYDCTGSGSVSDGQLSIGTYTIRTTANNFRFVPLRTRVENVSSNVRIGRLQGTIALTTPGNGAGIFQFAAGAIGLMEVDVLDLNFIWQTGATKDLTNWPNGSAVRIGQLSLNLIDASGTLTIADKFDFNFPTLLPQPSRLDSYTCVSPSGDIRITQAVQPQMQLGAGFEVSTTFGPYLLMGNQAFPSGRWFIGTSAPTQGTWNRGDTIYIKAPAAGGREGFICTTAGTPGTWKSFGNIDA